MIIPLLLTEKLEDLPNKCKLTPGKRRWNTYNNINNNNNNNSNTVN